MIPLTDQQTERVAEELRRAGLSYAPLRDELLDHLCTAIEAAMEAGSPFDTALAAALAEFGEAGLLGVEQQTLSLLTYKTRLMKRITVAASVLTLAFLIFALAGVAQHVPDHSPLPGAISVTAAFGQPKHPSQQGTVVHSGIDLRAETGTEVLATAKGIVVHAGENPEEKGYGIYVLIQHGEAYTTKYAHLSAVEVAPGQEVIPGQLIGKVGNTGYSKGPHLHYEVMKNGKKVDPAVYLAQ